MTTSGFYRSDLTYASNWVIAPNYELLRSAKDSYTYPNNGWYWFDSLELACNFFGLQLPSEFNHGAEFLPNEDAPDWVGFNLAISLDSTMVEYEVIANSRHPSIVSKKDLAYAFILTNGFDNFANAFPVFCQVAGVTQEHRQQWASLAESFNLPIEFIEIVRGV